MNKKTIILCVSAAAVLILGIALAVFFLYRGIGSESVEDDTVYAVENELLKAVPTDAVAVITVSDYQKALPLLPPSVKMPENLDTKRPFVVSLHNTGRLTPLFIFKDKEGSLHIESESQTLVSSSRRHLEENSSILDNKQIVKAFRQLSDKNTIVFINDYASNLLDLYSGKTYSRYAKAVAGLSEVGGFNVKDKSDRRLSLQGGMICGKSSEYFANVLKGQGESDSKIVNVLPFGVSLAISLQISDLKQYGDNYQKYLDNTHKLGTFDASSLRWAQSIALKEVAYVQWSKEEGEPMEALFVRTGKSAKNQDSLVINADAGKVEALFGHTFTVASDSCCTAHEDWIISGNKQALSDLLEAYSQQDLYDYSTNATIVTYARGSWNIDKSFPRSARRKSSGAEGIQIDIPAGPFEVTNCATGKTNEFYQNGKLALCLRDENGKGLWGIPFNEPICGRAQDVDIFKNGKIQFLFAYGTKIHLIDRLGRFVSGFPVDLGKEVLLGPDVYDFNGDKSYCVMVLHTDNTLEMYDLKGKKPEKWLGISCDEAILNLPELVEQGGKQYWVVTTSGGKYAFDLNGGDPLKGREIKNLIK